MSTSGMVVILNASHEYHQKVSLKQAMKMLVREVAKILVSDSSSMIGTYPKPRVLVLSRYVYVDFKGYKRKGTPVYSRVGVLKRDNYMCSYCGGPGDTVDHIIPKSRGGRSVWINVTTSCEECNYKKDSLLLSESGMSLLVEPFIPTFADIAG